MTKIDFRSILNCWFDQREEEKMALGDIGVTNRPRKVIIKGQIDTGKICPAGMEYCWECGHIDTIDAFLKENKCPNPSCPCPSNWND